MRLSRRTEPFDSDLFIFELKIDGFRSLAYIENGQCQLVSRNGNVVRAFSVHSKIWRRGTGNTGSWRGPPVERPARPARMRVEN